jgi:hypothetical protein
MKRSFILFFALFTCASAIGQTKEETLAVVEKVLNVPVFMYAYPEQDYEETGTITATFSAVATGLGGNASISDRTKELINKAKRKKSKGKISEFNAIIIDPDDFTGTLIVLSDPSNLQASVNKVLGVPVYLYSYPVSEYEEVKEITATWAFVGGTSSLRDQVSELVQKAKKQQAKGKVEDFDAIIISPDDFKGILIKFKD